MSSGPRLFLLVLLAGCVRLAAGATYEYVGSERTCLVVDGTVLRSATVEVDCAEGRISFDGIEFDMDPGAYVDAATRDAVRAAYRASPLVESLMASGVAEEDAIADCRARESEFSRRLQAMTNEWSVSGDAERLERAMADLAAEFADVVERLEFRAKVGGSAYKRRTFDGWLFVLPRPVERDLPSPCEEWTGRVERIVDFLGARDGGYRIVHVSGSGTVRYETCGSAEAFERSIARSGSDED